MANYHRITGIITVAILTLLASCSEDRLAFPRALSDKNAIALEWNADVGLSTPTWVDSTLWRLFPVLATDLQRVAANQVLDGRKWLIGLQYFQEYGWLPTFVTGSRDVVLPGEAHVVFRGVALHKFENGLYGAIHKDLLILGRIPLLVEDALRQLTGGTANFDRDLFFRREWRREPDADRRLFIRPGEITGNLSDFLQPFLSEYEWITLALEATGDKIFFNGNALPVASRKDRGSAGSPLNLPGDLVLPEHLLSFSYLKDQTAKLLPAYQSHFEAWWNGELLVFQLEGLEAPVFAFGTTDIELARQRFRTLGDQQGILEQERYQTFDLLRVLDDRLLEPWQPGGVRNPYGVAMGDRLFCSASRTALILCVDYYLTGRPSAFSPAVFESVSEQTNRVHWMRSGAFFKASLAGWPDEISWVEERAGEYVRIKGRAEETVSPTVPLRFLWKYPLAGDIILGPAILTEPAGTGSGYLMQDETNRLYLVDADGRLRWEKQLPDRVISPFRMAMIDRRPHVFFNTPTAVYAIDQAGEDLPAFPLTLPAPGSTGLQLIDFDQTGRPAIFIPTVDGAIYGYDLQGRLAPGWSPNRDTLPLQFPIVHLQENYRDLLIGLNTADSLLLWTRAGESAGVGWSLDTTCLGPPAVLTQHPRKVILVSATGAGSSVNIYGDRSDLRFSVGNNQDIRWCAADVDGDGQSEHVLSSGRDLAVYRERGASRTTVFTYRFPAPPDTVFAVSAGGGRPSLIGALDRQRRQLFLLDGRGLLLPGFPVAAGTPAALSGRSDGSLMLAVGLGRELMTYVMGEVRREE